MKLNEDEEIDEEELIKQQIHEVATELASLLSDETCMSRLHPIEKMIVEEVAQEHRHLKCMGCLRWITLLLKKAKGESWAT